MQHAWPEYASLGTRGSHGDDRRALEAIRWLASAPGNTAMTRRGLPGCLGNGVPNRARGLRVRRCAERCRWPYPAWGVVTRRADPRWRAQLWPAAAPTHLGLRTPCQVSTLLPNAFATVPPGLVHVNRCRPGDDTGQHIAPQAAVAPKLGTRRATAGTRRADTNGAGRPAWTRPARQRQRRPDPGDQPGHGEPLASTADSFAMSGQAVPA